MPAVGDRDSDDLRQNSSALFPPEFYVKFLRQQSIMTQIGAEQRYSECPDAPFELFTRTGDVNFIPFSREDELVYRTYSGRKDSAPPIRRASKLRTKDAYLGA